MSRWMPDTAAIAPTDPTERQRLRQVLHVVGTEGDRVHLRADRAAACAGCAARAGCATKALAGQTTPETLSLLRPAGMELCPGDEVVVSLPARSFLAAAGLAYLVPPAALALAAGLFTMLGWPDFAIALACIPVLALSFVPLWRAERDGGVASDLQIDRSGAQSAPHTP